MLWQPCFIGIGEMDDGLNSQTSGQFIANGSGQQLGVANSKQQNEQHQRAQYSMAGILHFLQTEWARFEMDRAQWDVEKAELQVGLACYCDTQGSRATYAT